MARSVYDRQSPIRPIRWKPTFSYRQWMRLQFLRYLIERGIVNEGTER